MYTSISQLYSIFIQDKVVTTDTRVCPKGSIFFALKGNNFDGNLFAHKALEAGCAHAVVDNPEIAKTDERYLLVEDVLTSLQQLASHHRDQLTIPVLGITGTNGKTTTKELTLAVLSQKYNTLATEGNLNNHIGVPLTLLKITDLHEFAIIEMGANHPYEIEALCKIAKPDFGMITNIGKAHLEGFGSYEGVIKTKMEMYDWIRQNNGKVFVNSDDSVLVSRLDSLQSISYAHADINASIIGKVIDADPQIRIQLSDSKENITIQTQLIGAYNLPNMLAAAAIGYYFGVTMPKIKEALESYAPQNKRSQLIKTDSNTIILDAYNANPTSMLAALQNFRSLNMSHKTIIIGDMRELGECSEEEHQRIIDWLEKNPFDKTIFVGEIFHKLNNGKQSYINAAQLAEELKTTPMCNQTILIKGSRGIALEQIAEIL